MRLRRLSAVLALFACIAAVQPARADLITYDFAATVTSIFVRAGHEADWDNSLHVGDIFRGAYTIDTSTGGIGTTSARYTSSPDRNGFQSLTLGDNLFGAGTIYNSHASTSYNRGNNGQYALNLDGSFTPQKAALGDQAIAYMQANAPAGSLFTSPAPPTTMSQLDALHPSLGFLQGHGSLGADFYSMPDYNLFVSANVAFTGVSVAPVPEPTVAVGLALGLTLLGGTRLRRRI